MLIVLPSQGVGPTRLLNTGGDGECAAAAAAVHCSESVVCITCWEETLAYIPSSMERSLCNIKQNKSAQRWMSLLVLSEIHCVPYSNHPTLKTGNFNAENHYNTTEPLHRDTELQYT